MGLPTAAATNYQVETSGWDLDENFFVEKTELTWDEDVKRVNLRHAVRLGALIFVRLLEFATQVTACPVAYEVVQISHMPLLRQYEVLLTQLQSHPRVPTATEEGFY